MTYAACPKCSHQPLPAEQGFPAACPGCGLILAKFSTPARHNAAPAEMPAEVALAGESQPSLERTEREGLIHDWIFHVPAQVARIDWQGRIAALFFFSLWTFFIWRDMDIAGGSSGSWFLHVILTPFHESGHYLIFRWFGRFIMTLGGTLGQHLLPIVVGGAFLIRHRNPFGAAMALWLLGYSLSDMGVYMYDAFDPQLMLLDGRTGAESDGHDWQNIFGDLGLLRHARSIGLSWGWAGKAVMLAGLFWGAWMLWLQRARLSESPFAEEREGD